MQRKDHVYSLLYLVHVNSNTKIGNVNFSTKAAQRPKIVDIEYQTKQHTGLSPYFAKFRMRP